MSTVAPPTFLPLGSLAQSHGTDRERLAEAAKQFEAIFVRQMLASARKADFGEPLLGGQALETFKTMQDERFADIAAKTGALGLASQIEAQISRFMGAPAGASTSSARAGIDTAPTPAQPELVEGARPDAASLGRRG